MALETEAETVRRKAELQDNGFTVIHGLYSAEEISRFRSIVGDVYSSAGSPTPYSPGGVDWLDENLEVSDTGFVIHRLLSVVPDLHRGLLKLPALEAIRAVLGDSMHIEIVAGIVTDHHRPFFRWHHHFGGSDDEAFRRQGLASEPGGPERLGMLLYLNELAPDTGQLALYPGRNQNSAPYDADQVEWPGEVVVSGEAGTVVVIDQTLWHSARVRTDPNEVRMFLGCWFAGAHLRDVVPSDEGLDELVDPEALFKSVMLGADN